MAPTVPRHCRPPWLPPQAPPLSHAWSGEKGPHQGPPFHLWFLNSPRHASTSAPSPFTPAPVYPYPSLSPMPAPSAPHPLTLLYLWPLISAPSPYAPPPNTPDKVELCRVWGQQRKRAGDTTPAAQREVGGQGARAQQQVGKRWPGGDRVPAASPGLTVQLTGGTPAWMCSCIPGADGCRGNRDGGPQGS